MIILIIIIHKKYKQIQYSIYTPRTHCLITVRQLTCIASPNIQHSSERIGTHFISRALSIPSFHPQRQKTAARLHSTYT